VEFVRAVSSELVNRSTLRIAVNAVGFAAIAYGAVMGHAQQVAPPLARSLSEALRGMQSKDLSTWERAFDDLMGLMSEEQHRASASAPADALANFFAQHPDQADRIKLALIQLLKSANDLFIFTKDPETKPYTENDTEHYANLITAVASLQDERAIPALAGAITTGGIATRGLLKYGDKALGPVLEQLNNPNALVRSSALAVSVTLLRRKGDPTSQKRAADLVRSALTDSSSVVRRQAVREISCLDNRQEFLPILEQISKTDPEKRPGKALDGGDADAFYPVRYDARQVLRDIQNNKVCAP